MTDISPEERKRLYNLEYNKEWRKHNANYRKEYRKKNLEKINLQDKKYKEDNSEKVLESKRNWRSKNSWEYTTSGKRMLSAAKGRAKQNNLPFNIELEDIVVPEICPILDIPLEFHKGRLQYNSPTLDRINNELGYVKGNVKVISHRANFLKNCLTKELWSKIGEYANWT